jgi:hypothetical protein
VQRILGSSRWWLQLFLLWEEVASDGETVGGGEFEIGPVEAEVFGGLDFG